MTDDPDIGAALDRAHTRIKNLIAEATIDPRDATIERLRAELAITYLHRTEYPGIAGRCAAAAKRAREGAEQ